MTNPASLPSFYRIQNFLFLLGSVILFHLSHHRSNWFSPSFPNNRFHKFQGVYTLPYFIYLSSMVQCFSPSNTTPTKTTARSLWCYIQKMAEEKLNIFQIFITVQNFTRTKCVTGVTLATKTDALVLLRILILGNWLSTDVGAVMYTFWHNQSSDSKVDATCTHAHKYKGQQPNKQTSFLSRKLAGSQCRRLVNSSVMIIILINKLIKEDNLFVQSIESNAI